MGVVEEWTQAQQRVIELVEGLDAEQAAQHVPACPAWTVRDLLSHMVGLGVDVLAGEEPDDHNEAWTARQVEARGDHDVAALVEEWRGITAPMQAYLRDVSPRPLGDIVIHEQDLRGALGVSGAQDTEAIAGIRERMAGRFAAGLKGMPVISLEGERWRWRSGDGEPAVVVRATDFDLARAVMSRRSAGQIQAWTVRGDVGPYLAAFGFLGALPESDLTE